MANSWTLTGVVADDPEYKTTEAGKSMLKVTVKETYAAKDYESQEWVSRESWHHIIAWGKQAEEYDKALAKGMAVVVTAPMRERERSDLVWASGYDKPVRVYGPDFGLKIEVFGAVAAQSRATQEPGPTRRDRQAAPVHDDVPPPDEDDLHF